MATTFKIKIMMWYVPNLIALYCVGNNVGGVEGFLLKMKRRSVTGLPPLKQTPSWDDVTGLLYNKLNDLEHKQEQVGQGVIARAGSVTEDDAESNSSFSTVVSAGSGASVAQRRPLPVHRPFMLPPGLWRDEETFNAAQTKLKNATTATVSPRSGKNLRAPKISAPLAPPTTDRVWNPRSRKTESRVVWASPERDLKRIQEARKQDGRKLIPDDSGTNSGLYDMQVRRTVGGAESRALMRREMPETNTREAVLELIRRDEMVNKLKPLPPARQYALGTSRSMTTPRPGRSHARRETESLPQLRLRR